LSSYRASIVAVIFIESSPSAFGASHPIKVPWSSLPLPSSQRDLGGDLGLVITCSSIYLVFLKRSFDEKAKKDQIKDEKKAHFLWAHN
jgi:hypothetical protein